VSCRNGSTDWIGNDDGGSDGADCDCENERNRESRIKITDVLAMNQIEGNKNL